MSNLTDYIKSIVEEKKSSSIDAFDSNEKIVSKKIDDDIIFNTPRLNKKSDNISSTIQQTKKDSNDIKHYQENKKENSDNVENYAKNNIKENKNISYTYSVSDKKIVDINRIEKTSVKFETSIDKVDVESHKESKDIKANYSVKRKYGSDNIVYTINNKNKEDNEISNTITIPKKPNKTIHHEIETDIILTNDINSVEFENNKIDGSINHEFKRAEKENRDIASVEASNKVTNDISSVEFENNKIDDSINHEFKRTEKTTVSVNNEISNSEKKSEEIKSSILSSQKVGKSVGRENIPTSEKTNKLISDGISKSTKENEIIDNGISSSKKESEDIDNSFDYVHEEKINSDSIEHDITNNIFKEVAVDEYGNDLETNIDSFMVDLPSDSRRREENLYKKFSQPASESLKPYAYYPAGSFKQITEAASNTSSGTVNIINQWDSMSIADKVSGITDLVVGSASAGGLYSNLKPSVIIYKDKRQKKIAEMIEANNKVRKENIGRWPKKPLPYPNITKEMRKEAKENPDALAEVSELQNINEMRFNVELNDIHIAALTDPMRYERGGVDHILKYDSISQLEDNIDEQKDIILREKKGKTHDVDIVTEYNIYVCHVKLILDVLRALKTIYEEKDFYGSTQEKAEQLAKDYYIMSDDIFKTLKDNGYITTEKINDSAKIQSTEKSQKITENKRDKGNEEFIGYIYAQEPFKDDTNPVSVVIPLQNNLTCDTLSRPATYNTIKFFKHFGSIRPYSNTESLDGIRVTTKYFVESEDSTNSKDNEIGSKAFTMQQLQKIELAYRSLVLPYAQNGKYTNYESPARNDDNDDPSNKYTYYLRPPIINIVLGNTKPSTEEAPKDNDYNSGVFNNFFTDIINDSTESKSPIHYKNYAVTSVSIDKNMDDEQNYYVINDKNYKGYKDAMGFTVSLELIEIDQDYINSMPSYNSYAKVFGV